MQVMRAVVTQAATPIIIAQVAARTRPERVRRKLASIITSYFEAVDTLFHYLLYGRGPGVWITFGTLVLGTAGVWLVLLRVATKWIQSDKLLAETSGVLLLTVLVAFALLVLVSIVATASMPSEV